MCLCLCMCVCARVTVHLCLRAFAWVRACVCLWSVTFAAASAAAAAGVRVICCSVVALQMAIAGTAAIKEAEEWLATKDGRAACVHARGAAASRCRLTRSRVGVACAV